VRRILVPVAVAALAALALVATGPEWLYGPVAAVEAYAEESPGLLTALAWLAIVAIPATLLHELGHALAALALLDTPVGVAVGSFGKVAELRLGQIAAAGAPAGAAAQSSTHDAARAEARDILWIAVAGPALSLAAMLASLAALSLAPAQGAAHDLFWAAAIANAVAVLHLLPVKLQDRPGGATLLTDGRLALDAARTLRALG
jgi:hypothetical protein